ncbi:hypothetical protein AB205_0032260 [Aquarana catesbeiana]|uniref:Uncharacterized protein n=1 Tax=Aquarana catesbeiana TaxID=8400 RepID=A0A2G9Q2D6_AQUCT|nr:hypothetical protein AB205_0032260 [Aquarana catesbeiana]
MWTGVDTMDIYSAQSQSCLLLFIVHQKSIRFSYNKFG